MALLYQEEPILFKNMEELQKYRPTQKVKFICEDCGKEVISNRYNISLPLKCRSCKLKETFKNKDWSERNKKSEETKLEKYDNAHYTNRQKGLETFMSKPQDEKDKIKEKVRQTNLERYSGHPAKREEQKQKTKQTCLEKYGCESPFQNEEVKQKFKDNYFQKYGVENPFQLESVKEKIKQHWKEKDKNNVFFKDEYTFGYMNFDSSLELYYYIYLKDNNLDKKEDLKDVFEYVDNKYTKDFVPLFKNNLPFPYPNVDLTDKSDYGIIRHFHKSIYKANRNKFQSPLNAWNNKDLIYKTALNRLKYVGSCKPSDIVYGFNVAKIAPKVSVFNPLLATNLIRKYLFDAKEIFDPFSGFSGRMIGAFNNNIKYIGQDINKEHIIESEEIAKYLNIPNVFLYEQDILKDMEKEYDTLFTCPPYDVKESWNENETVKSCDEWIDICLNKYNCRKYLFVIDETEKYKTNIVDEIINKSHFNENKEYIILIEK